MAQIIYVVQIFGSLQHISGYYVLISNTAVHPVGERVAICLDKVDFPQAGSPTTKKLRWEIQSLAIVFECDQNLG